MTIKLGNVVRDLSRSPAALYVVVFVVAIVPFAFLLGSRALVEVRYGHDVFHVLDAAHRIRLGQVPHRDFYMPYGVLESALVAWLQKLCGRSPLVFHLSRAALATVAALGAFALGRRRMPARFAALYAVVVVATLAGQHQLGFPVQDLSHSATYNRIGYALLAIVLVESLPLDARTGAVGSWRPNLVEGLASGFALGLCLFVKPTLPVIGGLIVVFSSGLGPARPFRAGGFVGGAVVALGVGGWLVRFDFASMLSDYLFAGGARANSVRGTVTGDLFLDMSNRVSVDLTVGRIVETIVNEAALIAVVAVLGGLAAGRPGARFLGARRDAVVLALAFSGLSLMTVITSWQWGESALMPMLAVAFGVLVVSEEHIRIARILASVATIPFLAKAFGSIVYACIFPALHPEYLDPPHAFADPSLRGLMMVGSDSACRRQNYVSRVEGGVANLRKLGLAEAKVLVLDFSNPFPYLLNTDAPRGTGIVWHANSTVSEAFFLSPTRMFGDADVVIVPKCAEDPLAVNLLLGHYGATLDAAFRELDHDENFVFLGKKRP